MHLPTSVLFVNDDSHVTLSGAKSKTIWVTLAMSGIDEVLDDFDMFATPIHEDDGPSRGSGLTPVAPPRASGLWARPSDAEFSQGRQTLLYYRDRGLGAHKGGKAIPNPDNFAHY